MISAEEAKEASQIHITYKLAIAGFMIKVCRMSNVSILFSGGVDSLCCAHFLMSQGFMVSAIHINYGQLAYELESKSSENLCRILGIKLKKASFLAGKSFEAGEISSRNLFLISAAMVCKEAASSAIAIGIHDGTKYYDCSKNFFEDIRKIVDEMTDSKVELLAPFLNWHKHDIFRYALDNNLPLGLTYSCESGEQIPCGECLSCQDRQILSNLQKNGSLI